MTEADARMALQMNAAPHYAWRVVIGTLGESALVELTWRGVAGRAAVIVYPNGDFEEVEHAQAQRYLRDA